MTPDGFFVTLLNNGSVTKSTSLTQIFISNLGPHFKQLNQPLSLKTTSTVANSKKVKVRGATSIVSALSNFLLIVIWHSG